MAWQSFSSKRPESLPHEQHNPPNPILAWFREASRVGARPMAATYVLFHWGSTAHTIPHTAAEESHAHVVIGRIAEAKWLQTEPFPKEMPR